MDKIGIKNGPSGRGNPGNGNESAKIKQTTQDKINALLLTITLSTGAATLPAGDVSAEPLVKVDNNTISTTTLTDDKTERLNTLLNSFKEAIANANPNLEYSEIMNTGVFVIRNRDDIQKIDSIRNIDEKTKAEIKRILEIIFKEEDKIKIYFPKNLNLGNPKIEFVLDHKGNEIENDNLKNSYLKYEKGDISLSSFQKADDKIGYIEKNFSRMSDKNTIMDILKTFNIKNFSEKDISLLYSLVIALDVFNNDTSVSLDTYPILISLAFKNARDIVYIKYGEYNIPVLSDEKLKERFKSKDQFNKIKSLQNGALDNFKENIGDDVSFFKGKDEIDKKRQETAKIKEETAKRKEETAKRKEETNKLKEETAKRKEETAKRKEETAKRKEETNKLKKQTAELKKFNEVNRELYEEYKKLSNANMNKINGIIRDYFEYLDTLENKDNGLYNDFIKESKKDISGFNTRFINKFKKTP